MDLITPLAQIKENKMKKNNIDNFDWASLKPEQTILQVDGPFIWAKIFFYLSAIRLPFVFVSILVNNPLLLFDFLIAVPMAYGQWQRKRWAWYVIMLNFLIYPFVPILLYEEGGILLTLISVFIAIPNLNYFWKRSKLFNVKQKDIDKIKTKTDVFGKDIKIFMKKKDEDVKKYMKEKKVDKTVAKSLETLKSTATNVSKSISKSLNFEDTPTEKLKELKSLLDDGVITKKEFEEKKVELLKRF